MVKLVKQIAPALVNSAAFESLVGILEHAAGERGHLLRVLTYHRVDELQARPWLDPGLISASPQAFEAQMRYLSTHYQPVSIFDVLEAFEKKGQNVLSPRAVLVTFDDAYHDFEKHAWPILEHYHIPVVLFVPSAFPDHPERLFWWDRLYHAIHTTTKADLTARIASFPISTTPQRAEVYTRLKNHIKTLPNDVALAEVEQICNDLEVSPHENSVLGWTALRKLARDGVTLAPHTQTHPIMNNIPPHAMYNEALGSLHDLRREIGTVPAAFAYPSGFHNEEVVEAVERAGFRLAFTTERGINGMEHAHPLRLQRINVGLRTTIPILRAQLLSWSTSIYPLGRKIFA
jgi:peptidoglycan/xylan/chitin deacetylase (PgdA/CDA1 family)